MFSGDIKAEQHNGTKRRSGLFSMICYDHVFMSSNFQGFQIVFSFSMMFYLINQGKKDRVCAQANSKWPPLPVHGNVFVA